MVIKTFAAMKSTLWRTLAQTLKTRRHESSLAPNLQLHKLPLQAIWWRRAVNGGASIAVTVRRSQEGRGESRCCHSSRSTVRKVWDDIGDISQASNSSSSSGNKWRKKLCLASQRRFTLNVAGKFMFKVSFFNTKIRQNVYNSDLTARATQCYQTI